MVRSLAGSVREESLRNIFLEILHDSDAESDFCIQRCRCLCGIKYIEGIFEWGFEGPASSLLAAELARVIHQNLAHQLGGDGEEVRTAFPIGQVLCN